MFENDSIQTLSWYNSSYQSLRNHHLEVLEGSLVFTAVKAGDNKERNCEFMQVRACWLKVASPESSEE